LCAQKYIHDHLIFRIWEASWEKRDAYKVLVGKPEGKRPLERPGQRWDNNIKISLQEIGWEHGLD
jgi:hypothetical protein